MKLTVKNSNVTTDERELINDLVCVTVHLEKSIKIIEGSDGEIRKRNRVLTKLQSTLAECEEILRTLK